MTMIMAQTADPNRSYLFKKKKSQSATVVCWGGVSGRLWPLLHHSCFVPSQCFLGSIPTRRVSPRCGSMGEWVGAGGGRAGGAQQRWRSPACHAGWHGSWFQPVLLWAQCTQCCCGVWCWDLVQRSRSPGSFPGWCWSCHMEFGVFLQRAWPSRPAARWERGCQSQTPMSFCRAPCSGGCVTPGMLPGLGCISTGTRGGSCFPLVAAGVPESDSTPSCGQEKHLFPETLQPPCPHVTTVTHLLVCPGRGDLWVSHQVGCRPRGAM